MAIGKKEPIVFLEASRTIEEGGGGIDTWVPVLNDWAMAAPVRNFSGLQDSQTMLTDVFVFSEIRQREGWEPNKKMKIRHRGIDRMITGIEPVRKSVPFTYTITAGTSL